MHHQISEGYCQLDSLLRTSLNLRTFLNQATFLRNLSDGGASYLQEVSAVSLFRAD